METDLSVDVIVLPFDDKTVAGGNLRIPNVCFSRTASILLIVAFLLTTALSGSVAFIIARQSSSFKENIDAFH
ncbi:unnamed protein product [Cylicocyclus nassatus]|uniref:Uncharacterized protein n=1 Tax=Cylicocyclus nassatus TaxID=53992 RepID=A0AA36GMI4_CYLNA|nr:unnamed protein product [Cylicocyclus nassatus]